MNEKPVQAQFWILPACRPSGRDCGFWIKAQRNFKVLKIKGQNLKITFRGFRSDTMYKFKLKSLSEGEDFPITPQIRQ
jgi:hypothetical protein